MDLNTPQKYSLNGHKRTNGKTDRQKFTGGLSALFRSVSFSDSSLSLTVTRRKGAENEVVVVVGGEFGDFGEVMLVDRIEASLADSLTVFHRISQIHDRPNLQIEEILKSTVFTFYKHTLFWAKPLKEKEITTNKSTTMCLKYGQFES